MNDYFTQQQLLTPPVERAAYSDRTAYVMAEMSRLAYFRFEGGIRLQEIMKQLKELTKDQALISRIAAILDNASIVQEVPSTDATNALAEILEQAGFELIQVFNEPRYGTQAFLCAHKQSRIAILAFRGTEKRYSDIKTDVRASLDAVEINGIPTKVHRGFYEAFAEVRPLIEPELQSERIRNSQLYITGHSLGGALATIAAKALANDSTGAVYTFGAPPVSAAGFLDDVKTPVYRVINYVDIVPRLPNPYLANAAILAWGSLYLLLAPFAGLRKLLYDSRWSEGLKKFLIDASLYRQEGYGSYLIGSGRNTKHRYNVSSFDRLHWWILNALNFKSGARRLVEDHSIQIYSDKLKDWALLRQ